jgi:N-sulfoglucosamine sulfohydrolase
MRPSLLALFLSILGCLAGAADPSTTLGAGKPNVLIITVDDMSCDSVGVFGSRLADTTPRIDQLSKQCMRFTFAHSVVGNCMPSRNVMWSGLYPHNNHIEGFKPIPKSEVTYPVLGDLMKTGGWFTGIRHKVSHSTPYSPYPWDIDLDTDATGKKPHVKDPPTYGAALTQGIEAAHKAGKPFCLMLNVADPHKPFYSEGAKGQVVDDPHKPSRIFTPAEVPVPGFLPDDPIIRGELSQYYSSVRRADDSVGSILDTLKASGEDDKTVIIFLSDHGMPLPFAKTQLYHHSTLTPLMIRWPGVTKPGSVDDEHMVSTVDLLPTLLDILGQEKPAGFDGRSFAGLLRGEKQDGWDIVFKEHNENAGGQNTPMRAVETRDWLYVFSPWSNGTRVMGGATAGTVTCRQMRVLAKKDPKVAARVDLFDHRVPEEAYQVRYDPDALTNEFANPKNATEVAAAEKALEDWMVRTHDPLLEVFRKRDDAAFREAAIAHIEDNTTPRKKRAAKAAATKPAPGAKPATAVAASAKKVPLIQLEPPATIAAGTQAAVKVKHTFPADLGERPIQVTLKDGKNGRLIRKTVKASGTGEIEVTFDIPAQVAGDAVIFAGLVGNSIQDALQHVQTKPLPLK